MFLFITIITYIYLYIYLCIDHTNDRRSTERRLQDSLYLIVKRNRALNPWQVPQGKIQSEENLRAATERVIDRAVGKINRWFIGNAPCGELSYKSMYVCIYVCMYLCMYVSIVCIYV